MRRFLALSAVVLTFSGICVAQIGRIIDWWTYAADSQRTGWEKNEWRLAKDDVKSFQLLWRMKLDNKRSGVRSLLPPVVLGTLVGYRGFKELAFVAGSADNIWAIDADLDRLYWHQNLNASPAASSKGCNATLTATAALPAPVVFRRSTPSAGRTPQRPARHSYGIFSVRPVYVLSSDGKLHQLNQSDGSEMGTPAQFVPPGSNPLYLNVAGDKIYTATGKGCDGQSGAIWSLDVEDSSAKPDSFPVEGAQVRGLGGVAVGEDGTVYAQTGDGDFDPKSNKFANTLLALTSDLKLKNYFALPGAGTSKTGDTNVATPVVFAHKGHDVVVTAGKDGRLYLLDSATLGGADHAKPLSSTQPLTTVNGKATVPGIWGNLSSWETESGDRYVLAAVWGPRDPSFTAPKLHGDTPNGFIASFKLQDEGGQLSLVPAWISRDMTTPAPPMIAKDTVFALSNGAYSSKVTRSHRAASVTEVPERGAHATLFALDGVSGDEIYSTGNQVTAPGNLSGLSIANGRLYFSTTDNTLNVFGKYLEH